jgi:hypothetical protein
VVATTLLLAAACVGPPVHFFSDPPPEHAVFTTLTDTVLVVRHEPGDSVFAGGVAFAFDVLDRAETAGETAAVQVVRGVLDAVPPDARLRGEELGAHDGEIYVRVQAQGLARQIDMMRADALVIRSVWADTVEVVVGEGEEVTVERWLALVLYGEAAASPTLGIR